jgi:hypothetical protein
MLPLCIRRACRTFAMPHAYRLRPQRPGDPHHHLSASVRVSDCHRLASLVHAQPSQPLRSFPNSLRCTAPSPSLISSAHSIRRPLSIAPVRLVLAASQTVPISCPYEYHAVRTVSRQFVCTNVRTPKGQSFLGRSAYSKVGGAFSGASVGACRLAGNLLSIIRQA